MEVKTNEIDIIGILKKLLREWKTILLFVCVFAVLGVISVITRTKEFKTDVILAPETSSSEMSSMMDDFGNLIGKSFGKSASDAIYPELYPNVMTSTTFLLDLFDVPVVLKDSTAAVTYYSHLKNDYKPSLLAYPQILIAKFIALFKEKDNEIKACGLNPFHLTKEQYNICNLMRKNVQCVVDQRTSIITVSVTDIDEIVAATMADTVTTRLQEYITDYRTQKARRDLEFISKMYDQAQKEYFEIQAEYAKFVDANMNVVKAVHKAQLENLSNEMQLKLNLYSSAAQQLQVARQRLQEQVPAFMIIQPAVVALDAIGLSSMLRLLLFCFVGGVLGAGWCLYLKEICLSYIKRKKN